MVVFARYLRISAEIEREKRIIAGVENLKKAAKRDKKIKKQAKTMKGTAEAKLRFYTRELTQILADGGSNKGPCNPPDCPENTPPSSAPFYSPALAADPVVENVTPARRTCPSPTEDCYATDSPVARKKLIPMSKLERQLDIEEKVRDGFGLTLLVPA